MKLGIISDIHEDVVNLERAITELERRNCDRFVCLGDISGFSIPGLGYFDTRNASRCIDIIKANCFAAVAGNHDLFPVRRIPLHNAGFNYPPYWYQLDYHERKKLAGDEVWLNEENELDPLIGAEHREFLKKLPEYKVVQIGSKNVLLSHYLFPDLTGSNKKYYIDFEPVQPHLDFMADKECKLGFSGHQHIEGICIFNETGKSAKTFGTYQLNDEMQWIVGPCIANGKWDNGFMIYDTENSELQVIPLNSPKRMMEVVKI